MTDTKTNYMRTLTLNEQKYYQKGWDAALKEVEKELEGMTEGCPICNRNRGFSSVSDKCISRYGTTLLFKRLRGKV